MENIANMTHRFALAAAIAIWGTAADAGSACPPKGETRASLSALKATDWRIDDDAARDAFARAIASCLASPDPALRDGVAFEALQSLLRSGKVSPAAMNDLHTDLTAMLKGPEGRGFARPFAALALSEIARADRVAPFLAPERRAALLDAAIAFLDGHGDFRGFDERVGWRHGVAHGADLLMQLSLNPALGKPELLRIRDAVARKISPPGHAYVFGESERLARPILFIARRGVFTGAEWTAWQAEAARMDGDAFGSSAALARRHNISAFLSSLYINVTLGTDTADDVLLPGTAAALRALP